MPEGLRRSPLLATFSAFAVTGLAHSFAPDSEQHKTQAAVVSVLDEPKKLKRAPLSVQTHSFGSAPLWEPDELNWEALNYLKDCSADCELHDQWVYGHYDMLALDCKDAWAYVGPLYDDPSNWVLLDSDQIDLSDFLHSGFELWKYAAEWTDEMDFNENLEQACDLLSEHEFEDPEFCDDLDEYLDGIQLAGLSINKDAIMNRCGDVTHIEFAAGVYMTNTVKVLECGLSLNEEGIPVSFWCTRGWRIPYEQRGDFFVIGGGEFNYLPSVPQIKESLDYEDLRFSPPKYSLGIETDLSTELVDASYYFEDLEPEDTAAPLVDEETHVEEEDSYHDDGVFIQDAGPQYDTGY